MRISISNHKSILSEVGSTGKIGGIMADMGCKKIAFVTDKIILSLARKQLWIV